MKKMRARENGELRALATPETFSALNQLTEPRKTYP